MLDFAQALKILSSFLFILRVLLCLSHFFISNTNKVRHACFYSWKRFLYTPLCCSNLMPFIPRFSKSQGVCVGRIILFTFRAEH